MNSISQYVKSALLCLFLTACLVAQDNQEWRIHDRSRPKPPVVTPGTTGTQDKAGTAPSDAVVLFDGSNLDAWQNFQDEPAGWNIVGDYMEVSKGGGSIRTRQGFGDCQLHVEWCIPKGIKDKGQDAGNSGVYLMQKYEVQVLNSYGNTTYADGQAASLYGQFPPDVNSSRPEGQWQTYDIIFRRPRFDGNGDLISPATITVIHNGVLVHNNRELFGPTEWQERPAHSAHPDRLPIMLQDHGNPTRFRNIWIRDLEPGFSDTELVFSDNQRKRYLGKYQRGGGNSHFIIKEELGQFAMYFDNTFKYNIYPESESKFFAKKVDAQIDFDMNDNGKITNLTLYMGGGTYPAKKVE